MPPRDPKPANSRRKSKANLDMPEPELAEMLHQYCDLRRRGFDQAAIKTKSSWTKRSPETTAGRSPKARNAWLPEKPGTGHDRMAAGHVRRWHRTQGHPKGVGPILASKPRIEAANRARRRQRASPHRPHHQKPKRNARQGFLAGRQRNPHAPAVRRRLPTQLPRQNSPYGSARKSPRGW